MQGYHFIRTVSENMALPAIFLFLAAVLFFLPSLTGSPPLTIPVFMPVGVTLIGIILGWRFGQANGALVLFTLLLCYLALENAGLRSDPAKFGQILYAGTAILLPVNMALFSLMEERGLLSYWGLIRTTLISLQAGALYWLSEIADAPVQVIADKLFHYRILPAHIDFWTNLPQPALILYFVAFVIITVGVFLRGGAFAGAILGALIASFTALHLIKDLFAVNLFMATAIMILAVMILQTTYRMAFIDELTGISGRRALLLEMKKLRSPYVIAMADIDHFKAFNDTYGHDTGDQVLRMVAGQLSKIGGGGKTYRYGGEEFTILLPGHTAKSARQYLERIRNGVEQSAFHIRQNNRPKTKPKQKTKSTKSKIVAVTVSIGMAGAGKSRRKPADVLIAADTALYRAKNAGRNQISS